MDNCFSSNASSAGHSPSSVGPSCAASTTEENSSLAMVAAAKQTVPPQPAWPQPLTPSLQEKVPDAKNDYWTRCEAWAKEGGSAELRGEVLNRIKELDDNSDKELFISGLGLTSLPPLPENLIKLTCSGIPIGTLPETLPGQLTHLNCDGCQLFSLPENLPNSLKELDCSNNFLKKLPDRMPEKLSSIDCSSNKIAEIDLNCPELVSLDCSKNKILRITVISDKLNVLECYENKLPEVPISKKLNHFNYKSNPLTVNHPLWGPGRYYSILKDGIEGSSIRQIVGLSRSILKPDSLFNSYIANFFRDDLGGLTFGVEVEGYYYNSIQKISGLFERFGFSCVEESEMSKYFLFSSNEWVSGILRNKKDLQFAQNYLSVLNNFGCFSDSKSGVHIHFGVSQFSEKTIDPDNAIYDKNSKVFRPTEFQLNFAKQFLINFAAIQNRLYSIIRRSIYAEPVLKAIDPFVMDGSMDNFIKNITLFDSFDAIERFISLNSHFKKCMVINLNSFETKGTFEFRGATKIFSSFMEVDPNLPIADIAFLQDLIGLSLEGARNAFNNKNPLSVCEGVEENADRYVQTSLMLGVVHALLQRDQCRRFETMKSLLSLRKFMSKDTLKKLNKLFEQLPDTPTDLLRQDFTKLILQHQALDPIPWGTPAELDTHAMDFCTNYHDAYGLLTIANMDALVTADLPDPKSAVNPLQPGSPRHLANVLFGTETLGSPQDPPNSGTST